MCEDCIYYKEYPDEGSYIGTMYVPYSECNCSSMTDEEMNIFVDSSDSKCLHYVRKE